jgi:hypothetical protein
MSNILILSVAFVVFISLYFGYKKIKNRQEKGHHSSGISQEIYKTKKHPKDEEVSLTLEEKIQLSWQFLTNIAEQIVNRFSQEDKNRLHDAGEKMNKHGMSYQHNIDQEAKITIDIIRTRTKEQNKNLNRSR